MATFTSFPKRSKISSIISLSASSSTAIPSGFNPSIISAVDNGLFSSVSRRKNHTAQATLFFVLHFSTFALPLLPFIKRAISAITQQIAAQAMRT